MSEEAREVESAEECWEGRRGDGSDEAAQREDDDECERGGERRGEQGHTGPGGAACARTRRRGVGSEDCAGATRHNVDLTVHMVVLPEELRACTGRVRAL